MTDLSKPAAWKAIAPVELPCATVPSSSERQQLLAGYPVLLSAEHLARLFGKSKRTIGAWVGSTSFPVRPSKTFWATGTFAGGNRPCRRQSSMGLRGPSSPLPRRHLRPAVRAALQFTWWSPDRNAKRGKQAISRNPPMQWNRKLEIDRRPTEALAAGFEKISRM